MRAAAKTAGQLPDRPGGANRRLLKQQATQGKANSWLMANIYSLNVKKIPMGRGDVKSLVGGLLAPDIEIGAVTTGWHSS